jgi:membrane protease YdiL (CAAX protease family)
MLFPMSHSAARWAMPIGPRTVALLTYAALALLAAAALPARLVTLLLIAPVLEEIVFRAGLQEALQRSLGPRTGAARAATVLSAGAFAAAHWVAHPGLLAGLTFVPALLIGHLYQTQRRLPPCIAAHSLCNGLGLWCGVIQATT